MKNVRTATLRKYIESGTLRLSKNDREFLKDLAKISVIDEKDADKFHYKNMKTKSSRRLDDLCKAGVLEKIDVNQPGRGRFKAYTFRSEKVAKLFGGEKVKVGRKRNALHEVITSKLYFAEGCPETFKLEARFTKDERELFKLSAPSLTNRLSALPDAMYVKPDGSIVVVEADSGQYNKQQIVSKQSAWTGFEQVWGQPQKAAARVTDNARVHCFT